jgi:arylsulfatase
MKVVSTFLVFTAAWLTFARGEDALAAARPNVIIVITDDQGHGDLSCHGNPVLKTPNLDRLYRESVRFTDFHVSPMCTPTRGQLLSGLDCLRNGAMNVSSGRTLLRRELPTMADLFAAAGYRCGQFGKWHLGDNYPYRPHDRGFHEAVYYPSSHISSAPDFWNNDYFDDTYFRNGRRESFQGYTTDVFFREAIAWMQAQAEAEKPFFCYLATAAAHGPLFVPDRYRQPYRDQKRNVASFYGMVANIDENIGRLEDFLKESGLRDNTILIFMTDNGGTAGVPVYNAGMRGRKIELYEGGHRVPCFWRFPQGEFGAPRDIGEMTHVQDVLPTLIDLCELAAPSEARFDGVSLAPLLRGQAERLPDRSLVIQFSRMNAPRPQKGDACVLWRRWRLIGDRELFDLESDPEQQRDVAAEHPEVVARMRAHYEKWWREIEPRLDEFEPIVLGADQENPALLSPCEWADVFLDQSAQVRRGERKNGVWHVEIAREGEYEIILRRWPKETGAEITVATPEYQAADGVYPAGVALPIVKARLQVQDFDQTTSVGADDQEVVFTARLQTGPAKLQSWFYGAADGAICGAYYVYVRRK